MSLDFSLYQVKTGNTAVYPGQDTVIGLVYCALGLGEAGELQGKVKKILRDDDGALTEEKRQAIADELGDVLWYAAQLATELDIPLEQIAQRNLDKLASRAERGTLQGSGDNR